MSKFRDAYVPVVFSTEMSGDKQAELVVGDGDTAYEHGLTFEIRGIKSGNEYGRIEFRDRLNVQELHDVLTNWLDATQ